MLSLLLLRLLIYSNQRYEMDQKNAGTNRSQIDQNSPIILDKENIQPTAHGNHSHGGIGTSTAIGTALSVASGKDWIRVYYVKESHYLIFVISQT